MFGSGGSSTAGGHSQGAFVVPGRRPGGRHGEPVGQGRAAGDHLQPGLPGRGRAGGGGDAEAGEAVGPAHGAHA